MGRGRASGVLASALAAAVSLVAVSTSAVGKTNIIPSNAVAAGDLRTLTPEQTERTIKAMKAIVDANLPGTDAAISFDIRYPPMAPTEGNRDLLFQLNAINRDLGLDQMDEYPPARRGAADISFVAPLVDAALAGMGPNGSGAHAEGESVDLRSFTRQAQRAAILMSRLAAQAPR